MKSDLIPSGWTLSLLGNNIQLIMGQAPPGNSYNSDHIGTVLVKVGEFGEKFPHEKIWTTKPMKYAKEGDVLLCVVGATIGKVNLGINCTIGRSVSSLRPDISKLTQKFLYYFLLKEMNSIRKSQQGSAQGVITKNDINSIPIPLPSLDMQKKITKKIDILLEHIEKRKIHILENYKNKFKILFTDKRNFSFDNFDVPKLMKSYQNDIVKKSIEGFFTEFPVPDWTKTEQKIDPNKMSKQKTDARSNHEKVNDMFHEKYNISEDWKWKKISDVCELISGQHILRNKYNMDGEGIPYLTGPNDFGDITPTISKWTENPKTIAKKNDVLITVKGAGVGKINLMNIDESVISRQLMALRPFALNHMFLYFFFRSEFNNLQKLADWTTIPGIGRESILNLEIPFPPIEFQDIIVNDIQQRISDVESIKKNLESILTLHKNNIYNLANLKNSILDAAFSGKLIN